MTITVSVILYTFAALVAAFLVTRFAFSIRAFLKMRGKRLVVCPETHKFVAVELNAPRAAEKAFFGAPYFRLSECTRWPERKNCGQQCLRQIEIAPDACLVKTLVTRWYEGKKCVYCGRPIAPVDWVGHKPALMNAEKKTVCWDSVPLESLPALFGKCSPVCWDCHIAETFRREHPEMVVDRPSH